MGLHNSECKPFIKKQMNYILGDTGRSYVVGFGNNPPVRPHHASSSCPDMPSKLKRTNNLKVQKFNSSKVQKYKSSDIQICNDVK
jgi:hypothetical protein